MYGSPQACASALRADSIAYGLSLGYKLPLDKSIHIMSGGTPVHAVSEFVAVHRYPARRASHPHGALPCGHAVKHLVH